jgi:hypothetical protein
LVIKEVITTKTKPIAKAILFYLLLNICIAQQLEVNWKEHKSGSIVQIYRTNGLYYGKAIASGNEIDYKKMKGTNLLLLKDFRQKQPNNY